MYVGLAETLIDKQALYSLAYSKTTGKFVVGFSMLGLEEKYEVEVVERRDGHALVNSERHFQMVGEFDCERDAYETYRSEVAQFLYREELTIKSRVDHIKRFGLYSN